MVLVRKKTDMALLVSRRYINCFVSSFVGSAIIGRSGEIEKSNILKMEKCKKNRIFKKRTNPQMDNFLVQENIN